MGDFVKQLQSYRLTTAEILYHMPDHPHLLQTFIWQELDIAPRFPVLCRFLDFWSRRLDGKLHSVRVASTGLIKPPAPKRRAPCREPGVTARTRLRRPLSASVPRNAAGWLSASLHRYHASFD